jgi:hypothetical protein
MQEGRQIRRRNSVGDLREGYQKTIKPPVQRKNVTDKVIDARFMEAAIFVVIVY